MKGSLLALIMLVACGGPAGHSTLLMPAHGPRGEPIDTVLRDARHRGRDGRFVEPSAEARQELRHALAELARGRSAPLPSGLELVPVAPSAMRAIREIAGHRAGSGVFVIRERWSRAVVVEVPHSFTDTGTLPLGVAVFEEARAKALLVDTVHRYRGAGCDPTSRAPCPSDMAHFEATYFQAAHEALATEGALTLALHGFADREELPDVVLSDARTGVDVDPWEREMTRALGEEYRVGVYPRDVQVLGGTTGVQAKFARSNRRAMVHIELSNRLRTACANDASLRARLVTAIVHGCAAWTSPEP